MARTIHGNVRASDDGKKYFLSGNINLPMKVLAHGNKIATNGTDEVELLLVVLDRCNCDSAEFSKHLTKARDIMLATRGPNVFSRGNQPQGAEGQLGVTRPVGELGTTVGPAPSTTQEPTPPAEESGDPSSSPTPTPLIDKSDPFAGNPDAEDTTAEEDKFPGSD